MVVVFILLSTGFKGVTLEYVVIDGQNNSCHILSSYCVMGPVTAIYTFYLKFFQPFTEFYKRGPAVVKNTQVHVVLAWPKSYFLNHYTALSSGRRGWIKKKGDVLKYGVRKTVENPELEWGEVFLLDLGGHPPPSFWIVSNDTSHLRLEISELGYSHAEWFHMLNKPLICEWQTCLDTRNL